MSNSKRRYRKNSERRIYVRGERHDPPDTYLLARALLDLAGELGAAKQDNQATADDTDTTAERQARQSEERT
ncbi:hypothetical protein NONI108955_22770 [Nocardia ninae]|uniref:Uncharacterized protein n=1 Tax=Nocardia ninae NBRC 108245 TaxID=1210091 RepID=A0A511MD29_9NOCA|nr:hypothetical protein [Nocardia ninae]GEM38562.1 hypothetical protein NN4_30810 [Nocardia ninae NBRC 108245]